MSVVAGVITVCEACEIPPWEMDNEDWDDNHASLVAAKQAMMSGANTSVDAIMQSPEVQEYLRAKVTEALDFIQNFVGDNEV